MEQQETKIAKKDLIRKKTGYPGMEIHKSGEVEYLTFPALERLNIVTHMVTSRFGGVSTGDCASFNFSYARDTSREAVGENLRRACSGQLRKRSSAPIRPIRQTSAVWKKRMQERA